MGWIARSRTKVKHIKDMRGLTIQYNTLESSLVSFGGLDDNPIKGLKRGAKC
jgi:hypothetical protein